jgi:hypothetical protein
MTCADIASKIEAAGGQSCCPNKFINRKASLWIGLAFVILTGFTMLQAVDHFVALSAPPKDAAGAILEWLTPLS